MELLIVLLLLILVLGNPGARELLGETLGCVAGCLLLIVLLALIPFALLAESLWFFF